MQCTALRNVAFEDLGVFREVLEGRGFTIEYRQAGVRPLDGADWLAADLVVVLGGPIGVYEVERYPWLADEIDGVRTRLEARLPTLGVCLGAHLLASTPLTPNQAFSVGDFALATQFHAEADGAAIEPWLIGHSCELAQAGVSVPALRARSAEVAPAAREAGVRMLRGWLDGLFAA